jgi:NDP-sugar pyrophosphorylase family protein
MTKALIFAAGLGTRLRPLTNEIPKALVPVCGKPMLEHVVKRLAAQGITDFVVNVHHFADKVIDFLAANKNFGLQIEISDERNDLLETGGGLVKARPLLENSDAILIHNADVLTNINIAQMLDFHLKTNSIATLAIQNQSSSRQFCFDKNKQLSGWKNVMTGEEIGLQTSGYKSFTGVHIVSPKIFDLMTQTGKFSITPEYLRLCATQKISAFDASEAFWFDIGSPEKLSAAEVYLSKNDAM